MPEHSLTIVIPALNEEDAIASTITRCLEARSEIMATAGLSGVEVIVVSDGSTDRTAEIAQGFSEVKVIVFEQNRGYGAAIKEGWRQGQGDLVGFLDADGTCDPRYFADMCHIVIDEMADVVLGSRLGPDSKMPPLRRLGNRGYAFLLGLLCGRAITDTASGMRVVRRESLNYLYPLPDGLHFTPSMSARALLNDLRIIEIPMQYEERIGVSKLNVVRDGVRFLRTIFAGVLCFQPERILVACLLVGVACIFLLGANPSEYYLKHQRLEEWMIYRFVVCHVIGSVALMLLFSIALINRIAQLGPRRNTARSFWPALIAALLRGRFLVALLAAQLGATVVFLWPGIIEYATSAQTTLHWSRLLAGSFTLLSACQTAIFTFLIRVAEIWTRAQKPADTMITWKNTSRASQNIGPPAFANQTGQR